MYEYLTGRVALRSPARLVLDVGGIGYDLSVPLGASFPPEGEDVRAWTHLVVREDAHTLYGFRELETRDLFRLLLSVRGVGPGTALGVLSGLTPDKLIEAIAAGDAASIQRVKGVGKKTAEQILLDLRDKAVVSEAASGADSGSPASGELLPRRQREDAVQALVSIGYSAREAEKSVDKAAARVEGGELEELVRTALAL